MTDRSFLPPALVAAAALVLTLSGCSDPAETAVEPTSPTSSGSSTGEPTETTSGPVDDVCDAVDVATLGDLAGVTLQPPEPYEEGPNMADGCFVTTEVGGLSIAIDVRTKHGSLDDDLQFVRVTGREEPSEVTVAGAPALYIYDDPKSYSYSGVVTHAGDDVAVAVVVQNFDEDGVGADQMQDLALGAAEMVAPVV